MRLYEDLDDTEKASIRKACEDVAAAWGYLFDPESLYNTCARPYPSTLASFAERDRLPRKNEVEQRLRMIGDEVRREAG